MPAPDPDALAEARAAAEAAAGRTDPAGDPICPLCERPIPPEAKQSLHHLIPKMKGGTHGPTVRVHQICHNEVHAVLTEAELARRWNTPAKLRDHPALAKVWAWLARKPPTFHARSRRNIRLRRGR